MGGTWDDKDFIKQMNWKEKRFNSNTVTDPSLHSTLKFLGTTLRIEWVCVFDRKCMQWQRLMTIHK